MFYKTDKERSFAYSTHTACDEKGYILGLKVTAGNVHDSTMLKDVVEDILINIGKPTHVVIDAGYRNSYNSYMLNKLKIQGVMPYKRTMKKEGMFSKREFLYDEFYDCYICPEDEILEIKTVDRNGYKQYKSDNKKCKNCSRLHECTSNAKTQRTITRHVWENYLDENDHYRLTFDGKMLYKARKETIERSFGDAKEQHGMRYTRLRGRVKVEQETFLTFACLNLKKMMKVFERDTSLSAFLLVFELLIGKKRIFITKNSKPTIVDGGFIISLKLPILNR